MTVGQMRSPDCRTYAAVVSFATRDSDSGPTQLHPLRFHCWKVAGRYHYLLVMMLLRGFRHPARFHQRPRGYGVFPYHLTVLRLPRRGLHPQ